MANFGDRTLEGRLQVTYPISLPQVGESVTEAVVDRWLKRVGDHVDKFDPIAEVVTDKVNMEFPAPESGTITEILVEEGSTVPMGAVIARMSPDDPGVVPPAEEERPADAATGGDTETADRIGRMVSGANVGPTGGTFADTSVRGAAKATSGSGASPRRVRARPGGPDRSGRYSPVVLRLAQERGVNLASVTGTGIGGRITKRDVLAAAHSTESSQGSAPTAAPGASNELVEPSAVRKIIAANMVRSWSEIPHAWTTVPADVSGLIALRAALRDGFEQRHGAPLTLVAFSVYAVARSLRENPLANASWRGGNILMNGHVNVGVAVAAADGLVVPVLDDADRMSVTEIALALAPLVERARAGKLTLDDVRGGTFTLNNTGALGSVWGGAIINHPQAAILNTEAVVKRPVVIDGPDGDAIAIRSVMNLCLSFDHRVLDGAEAAAFVHCMRRHLEQFRADSEIG